MKTPYSEKQLDTICKGLELEPTGLLRTKDKRFKELELSKKDDRSRKEWIRLMIDNPSMIERPVVEFKNKYKMGRPPDSIISFIEELI